MNRNPSQYAVVASVFLAVTILCGGRDLRPSEHGLAYQVDPSSPPPAQSGGAQEMLSFFGAGTSPPPSVELPEAENISDALRGGGGARAAAWGDRLRLGLLVASGTCGLIGTVLLAVSGVVFLVRLRKRKLEADGGGVPATSAPVSADAQSFAVNEK